MRRAFLILFFMIGLFHQTLQAKTTAESNFKKICARLGMSKDDAQIYLAMFEMTFEKLIAKDMKKTWRENHSIEMPLKHDVLVEVVLTAIPTKLIIPNQVELDVLCQQSIELLGQFYYENPLPWNVELKGLKKWKRKPKIPLTELTGYLGKLKTMALNQVNAWLRAKFGLTEKREKTVSMAAQMRLLSNEEWVNAVLDEDEWELVDQQTHHHVSFSDSDVPEEFINGGGDLGDEEKRVEREEMIDATY